MGVEGGARRKQQTCQPPRKRRRSTTSQSKKVDALSPETVAVPAAAVGATDGVSAGRNVTASESEHTFTKGVVCVSDTAGTMSVLDVLDGQVLARLRYPAPSFRPVVC